MKNKKLFGVIHILDILWAVLLIVLVFAAIQFSMPRQVSARTGDVLLRYTIELGGAIGEDGAMRLAPAGFHENIQIGEALFDGTTGQQIGRIVYVYAEPFTIDSFDEDSGTFRRARVAGLEYVYIIVEAGAQVSDYETLIGNVPIQVGRVVFIRSKYFAGEGFITAMEWVN